MKTLKHTAILITIISVLVKFSGFIRESIIVKEFGANELTDGYFLAFSFILLVITLIATGFNTIFLPLYVKNKNKPNNETNANAILNYTFILFLILSIVGYFTADSFVPFLFSDMHPVTENIAIELTQTFMIFLSVIVLNNVLETYLQAKRIFVPSQFAKLFAAIFTAIFALLFSEAFGIVSLAYGFFLGSLLGVILQVFYLVKTDYKWLPSLKIEKKFRNTFIALLLPALMYSMVGQVNVFVDKIFATKTVGGAITYLNNASLLVSIPGTIFATTIGAIIFTLLSEQVDNKETFENTFLRGIKYGSIVLIPITLSIVVIGEPLISFIYERGLFTSEDTANTAIVLLYYTPLILLTGLQLIISKGLYAKSKIKLIFFISATTIILNVVLNTWFVKIFGYPGLALSSSAVALYYLFVSGFVLVKDFERSIITKSIVVFFKALFSSLPMGAVLYSVMRYTDISSLYSLIQLIIYSSLGFVIYLATLVVFFPEMKGNITKVVTKNKRH